MKECEGGWSDSIGSNSICNLTLLMESLEILDDTLEHIAYEGLINFWKMKFIPHEDKNE